MPVNAGTPWLTLLEPLADPVPRKVEEAVPADLDLLRADADAVLAAARTEAAELLDDARTQSEALREAAWQEGFHQGQTEARTAVEAELRSVWETRQAALRTEVETIVAEIATARAALWECQESEMVALTLDIARQVVKTEVSQSSDVVLAVIANAIRRITDKDNVRVRVSLADAPHVKEAREDLMEMVDGLRFLEIVDDRRISPGGCVIETNAGTIDARIETQLAEVAKALGVTEDE